MSNIPTDLGEEEEVLSRPSMKRFRPSSCGLSKLRMSYEKKHGVMDLPNDLVLSRSSLKRVRSSSCEEWNGLSKRKTSFEKKHDVMDLPNDLAEEVLSRVPLTSLSKVRSTCKTWNVVSRSKSFAKKHLALERKLNMVVMMADYKLSLMSINLDDKEESCIKPRAKLISVDDHVDDQQTHVSQVFHHHGLLFCLSLRDSRLVVWNPYLGHTRWIDTKPNLHRLNSYVYAFGYNMSTKSHKILRFVNHCGNVAAEFNIYDLNSGSNGGSCRVLDFGSTQCQWEIADYKRGFSIKGNTYWCATDREDRGDSFLICFDFTKERFGPRLPLPPSIIVCPPDDTVILSSVREEQLVLLIHEYETLMMEIWITTKIDPNNVSWSNKFFLRVNMRPLIGINHLGDFFIDEEKKVAVVFGKDKDETRNVAYIIGADGSLKKVDLGESPNKFSYPLVCPYVPSSLLLN